MHGDKQSKLTLTSESLRNDGRIWVPKKIEDAVKLRKGRIKGSDIPEEDRDYYLERRYPAFGNLVPRDVASRAAKERCDKGFGVNNTGLAVFLDFSEAINRLGLDVVRQRYGNLFDVYEEITDVNPGELANRKNGVNYYNPMMIFPAIHYTMGGIRVDYGSRTSVKGLFAIGECNFSDHGANRLGASALIRKVLPTATSCFPTQSVTISATGSPFRVSRPTFLSSTKQSRNAGKQWIALWQSKASVLSIRSIRNSATSVWEYVGMARNKEGLEKAIQELKRIRKEFDSDLFIPGSQDGVNIELDKAFRLNDFITRGRAYGLRRPQPQRKLRRPLPRGIPDGRGRSQARRRELLLRELLGLRLSSDNEAPSLIKEPLHYEAIKVQTRNYKS